MKLTNLQLLKNIFLGQTLVDYQSVQLLPPPMLEVLVTSANLLLLSDCALSRSSLFCVVTS